MAVAIKLIIGRGGECTGTKKAQKIEGIKRCAFATNNGPIMKSYTIYYQSSIISDGYSLFLAFHSSITRMSIYFETYYLDQKFIIFKRK